MTPRRINLAEAKADALQLAANLTRRCSCDCHANYGHCDTCCIYDLCTDCLNYALGG